MRGDLVLSLFPGIGLLDRAFEEEGFCVVRGPDLLWGGDVRTFHPPAGRFDGVIGGPPCQAHSRMAHIARARGFQVKPDMIPEFVRCVLEAQPAWWVMENVQSAPVPAIDGYQVHAQFLNTRWLGEEQNRLRRFSFGTRDGRRLVIETMALEPFEYEPAVLAGAGRAVHVKRGGSGSVKATWKVERNHRPLADALRLQGLPPDFLEDAPFTAAGKQLVIGNGVPLPMGRAVARAVRRALATAETP